MSRVCVPDPGFAGRHSGSVHAGRGTGSGSGQPHPETAQEGSVSFLLFTGLTLCYILYFDDACK